MSFSFQFWPLYYCCCGKETATISAQKM